MGGISLSTKCWLWNSLLSSSIGRNIVDWPRRLFLLLIHQRLRSCSPGLQTARDQNYDYINAGPKKKCRSIPARLEFLLTCDFGLRMHHWSRQTYIGTALQYRDSSCTIFLSVQVSELHYGLRVLQVTPASPSSWFTCLSLETLIWSNWQTWSHQYFTMLFCNSYQAFWGDGSQAWKC